jgi:hypothetical protein
MVLKTVYTFSEIKCSKHRDRKKKKGFKQTKTTKNNMDWSE